MIHITQHISAKMAGMVSINTSALQNAFCQSMSRDPDNICFKCYARRLEKVYRAYLPDRLASNASILAHRPIEQAEIPMINRLFVRLHSFGELYNRLHFENFCRIAEHNSAVQFTL